MTDNIKELIINNIVFARYVIDGETIHLKMLRKIIPDNEVVSENVLIMIAKSLEDTNFTRAAYLNN